MAEGDPQTDGRARPAAIEVTLDLEDWGTLQSRGRGGRVIRRTSGAARSAQRGVALIMAVLMVALATILAVNVAFRGMLDQRRTATIFAHDQSFQIALGAEAWAADFLRQDKQETQTDHLGEPWARPMPPLPVDGGSVAGRLEDMQGRFNLNNLLFPDGTVNGEAVKQLERILARSTSSPAGQPRWRTGSTRTRSPGFRTARRIRPIRERSPYLAANMPITRASELMSLPDSAPSATPSSSLRHRAAGRNAAECLHRARHRARCAPARTQREFGLNPEDLANRRKDACFPTLEDLKGSLGKPIRQDEELAHGIERFLPRDGMGHYWHY